MGPNQQNFVGEDEFEETEREENKEKNK